MPRVFITGSSDGLGLMAAKLLIEQGHQVILHGRNDSRSREALAAAAGAAGVVKAPCTAKVPEATPLSRDRLLACSFEQIVR
jgi:NAD(P)-dependent dehydrogenase (short-subunit alcohol dehydrogenase family)